MGCEVVLSGIEEQVSRANQHKEQQLGLKQQIESEVSWQDSKTDPGSCSLGQLSSAKGFGQGLEQTGKVGRDCQVLEPSLLSSTPFILAGRQP